MTQNDMKELVARHVVEEHVRDGMKLGLGSGTTSECAVRWIGKRYNEGALRDIVGVPTSTQTELVCQELGIPIRTLNDPTIDGRLDLAIDGPDEVDRRCNLTKGGGGALTREKIVDYAATSFLIIADETKLVAELGHSFAIPLEVLSMARVSVQKAVERLGGTAQLRMATRKMGAVITDNGNIILDVLFEADIEPEEYERALNNIPGVVENGLFAVKKSRVYVAYENGEVKEFFGT
ncbi:MAG: ribose-5-phosphate isomerase RpiA [Spirochaetota bacterium]